MKYFQLLLFSVVVTACSPVTNIDVPTPEPVEPRAEYKESILKGEIPVSWSYVSRGDVGPMPFHENGWIETKYIAYSFAEDGVSYGDMNWTQVDIAFMEADDFMRWLAHLKNDAYFNEFVAEWRQDTLDEREVDIAVFATEPDGTVSKGATGGTFYFVHPSEGSFAVLLAKQSIGSEAFEQGVEHFLSTVDFDSVY